MVVKPSDISEEYVENVLGLWRNLRDSLAHALLHFSEVRQVNDKFHHPKWIILSVHHAAEVFCNYVMTSFDPAYPKPDKRGRRRYLSLRQLLDELPTTEGWSSLSDGEQELIQKVFEPLSDTRDLLMHRVPPARLEVSDSAIALLALLLVIRRRGGATADDLVGQSPRIEGDVFDALHYAHHGRYFRLMEKLVAEQFDPSQISGCPYCNSLAVVHEYECEACFEEVRP
jgi:hypothetical protein